MYVCIHDVHYLSKLCRLNKNNEIHRDLGNFLGYLLIWVINNYTTFWAAINIIYDKYFFVIIKF